MQYYLIYPYGLLTTTLKNLQNLHSRFFSLFSLEIKMFSNIPYNILKIQ